MATRVVLILFLSQGLYQGVYCEDQNKGANGLLNTLSNGMKFAKDFLASESVAQKVAEFVVKAFQTTTSSNTNRRKPIHEIKDAYVDETNNEEDRFSQEPNPNNNVHGPANPLTPLKHLVRLFGLQPTQISAVAVNALLFVAQMISTFLAGPKQSGRPYRSDDDTLTWILNKRSQKLQELIATAKNESLPEIIEDYFKEQESKEDIGCVKLLICKMTPLVSKMQKAVFGKKETEEPTENGAGASAMYRHLPSENEFNEKSDYCERKYKECELN